MNRIFVWVKNWSDEERNLMDISKTLDVSKYCHLYHGPIFGYNVSAYVYEIDEKGKYNAFKTAVSRKRNKAYDQLIIDDCGVYNDKKERENYIIRQMAIVDRQLRSKR